MFLAQSNLTFIQIVTNSQLTGEGEPGKLWSHLPCCIGCLLCEGIQPNNSITPLVSTRTAPNLCLKPSNGKSASAVAVATVLCWKLSILRS